MLKDIVPNFNPFVGLILHPGYVRYLAFNPLEYVDKQTQQHVCYTFLLAIHQQFSDHKNVNLSSAS